MASPYDIRNVHETASSTAMAKGFTVSYDFTDTAGQKAIVTIALRLSKVILLKILPVLRSKTDG